MFIICDLVYMGLNSLGGGLEFFLKSTVNNWVVLVSREVQKCAKSEKSCDYSFLGSQ